MIFITGPHNVGKSTLANWLEQYGFVCIETGDIVRQKHKELAPDTNFYDWAASVNEENPNFLNQLIAGIAQKEVAKITDSGGQLQDLVIVGNRQLSGIQFLIQEVNQADRQPVVISINAPTDELYRRHFHRADGRLPNITPDEFEEYLAFDRQMGLDEIAQHADISVESSSIENTRVEINRELGARGYLFKEFMPENMETNGRIF